MMTPLFAAARAPRILLVTDPAYGDTHIERVVQSIGEAIPGGEFAVQLRDKRRGTEAVRALAARLRSLTAAQGVPLLINRDVALAVEVGADGVHLGGDGLPGLALARQAFPRGWISAAAHSDADVLFASDNGLDAVLVSPIYATPGKGPPRGLPALESACACGGPLAIYALGGIDASRVAACAGAGATGVAVLRALLAADDPVAEARAILAALPERRAPAARFGSQNLPKID
jgi:thiamine-phosphate pyrophosphorylase